LLPHLPALDWSEASKCYFAETFGQDFRIPDQALAGRGIDDHNAGRATWTIRLARFTVWPK
jgi:hypothetical protein